MVGLGSMVAEGWQAGGLPGPSEVPHALVVCGLGGSAIAGDLLATLLAPSSPVPVLCVRDERLPAYVGARTLVVVCSYSGDTEETLAAYEAARRAGAWTVAVTSGGRLADLAHDHDGTLIRVRPGLQPRASLPLLLLPILRLAAACGLTPVGEREVRETAALLDGLAAQWGPGVPVVGNAAKSMARAIFGAVPVVYAASPRLEPVARRWKTQFNENAKTYAVANVFPELVHNEVVGWHSVRDGSPALHVVILRDRDDGARAALRVDAARDVSFGPARGMSEVWTQGASLLTRLFSLILFGDLVSAYLAVLRGVNPTPVEAIARIKERLGAG
jgi:glucose/mannose-6-phosphate isomerase